MTAENKILQTLKHNTYKMQLFNQIVKKYKFYIVTSYSRIGHAANLISVIWPNFLLSSVPHWITCILIFIVINMIYCIKNIISIAQEAKVVKLNNSLYVI